MTLLAAIGRRRSGNPIPNDGSGSGGTVSDLDNYRVHAFYESGTFTLDAPATVEYLVVGGGGSGAQGGGGAGGGGGGGGVRIGTVALDAGSYAVVVGAGGAQTTTTGNPGGASSFAGITASGGGAGSRTTAGGSGGSGGGGAPGQTGGAGTSGQGYAGSAGLVTGSSPNRTFAGGAGGGAGGVGQVGDTATQAGAGGIQTVSSITGRAIGYAGGGGGASGNDSGGSFIYPGDGGNDSGGMGGMGGMGEPGAIYRGGGGGGGGLDAGTNPMPGAAGGSGVVVIRYARAGSVLTAHLDPPQPSGWEVSDAYLRVSNQRAFVKYVQDIREELHGPSGCVTTDGSLLIAYRSGFEHHSPGRTEIIRGRHRTYLWETPDWEAKPLTIIDPPDGYDDVRDAKLLTLPNGNILTAYCVQLSTNTDISHARVRISTDSGVTFGPEINPATSAIPEWTGKLVPQNPTLRADGSILMPLWGTPPSGWVGANMPLLRSTDGGQTWALHATIANGVEPELIQGAGASEWLCLYRNAISRSTDDGLTWTPITTNLDISNWVKPVRSTATGNLIACVRTTVAEGYDIVLRVSADEGATWTPYLYADSIPTTNHGGAHIFERAPRVFILVHAAGTQGIKCSLLEEVIP